MYHYASSYRLRLTNIDHIRTSDNAPIDRQLPFSLTLPDDVPSSFDSNSFGAIRYYVRAYFNNSRYQAKQFIRVVRPLDLNCLPAQRLWPVIVHERRESNLTLCGIGGGIGGEATLSADMIVDNVAVVCGDSMPIRVEIANQWSTSIKCVNVALVQDVVYRANAADHRTGRKTDTKTIAQIKVSGSKRVDKNKSISCHTN